MSFEREIKKENFCVIGKFSIGAVKSFCRFRVEIKEFLGANSM